jgi:hypothetical protein
MVIGILKVNLIVGDNHSLKGKRGILKTIQSQVGRRFNVSVTECGDQDLWQSAVLGFGMVGSSRPVVEASLQKIVDFIDGMGLAELAESETEFFHC